MFYDYYHIHLDDYSGSFLLCWEAFKEKYPHLSPYDDFEHLVPLLSSQDILKSLLYIQFDDERLTQEMRIQLAIRAHGIVEDELLAFFFEIHHSWHIQIALQREHIPQYGPDFEQLLKNIRDRPASYDHELPLHF